MTTILLAGVAVDSTSGVAQGATPVVADATHGSAISGPFSTSGLWITDRAGQRLVLRGMDGSGDEYTPTGSPLPFDAQDFIAIRRSGATVVRIPIAWANIEPRPGVYDRAALDRVRRIVDWAGAAGLLVVLDMHQYDWSPCFGGNGMPPWAVPGCPQIATGAATPAAAAPAETAFWASGALQGDFASMWAAVARTVGDPPWLLGYDILNEPPAGLVPPGVFETAVLPQFYRLVGRALRVVNPAALLFVEPAWLHSVATPASFFLGPIGLARLVYAPHEYGTALDDGSGNVGNVAGPVQFEPDLAATEEQARRMGAAWWIGEWGDVDESAPGIDAAGYVPSMLEAQDVFEVGSAYWTYTADGGWPYTQAIASQLASITPAAVAGRPTFFTTAPRHMELRWRAGRGVTLVSFPQVGAVQVTVLEGSVSSEVIGPGWLALRAPPGARASVVVTSS